MGATIGGYYLRKQNACAEWYRYCIPPKYFDIVLQRVQMNYNLK
jgi:hypothetical protein